MRLGLGIALGTNSAAGVTLLTALGGVWRLDDSLTDASGNGRTLTGTGAGYSSSVLFAVKNACLLNGRADAIYGGTAGLTLANTDLTLCAWFSHNSPPTTNVEWYVGWNGVLAMFPCNPDSCGVGVAVDGGAITAGASTDVTFRVPTHFALTWDCAAGVWTLYKDGSSLRTDTVAPSNLNALHTANFELCASQDASKMGCDMALAYTRKLTASEITTLATVATCDPTV